MEKENLFIKYLQSKGLSEITVYRYGKCYDQLEKYPFTQEGINAFLSKGKWNNSVSHAFLKTFFEFINEKDKFVLPPKPKHKRKRIIRSFTQEDIQKMRDLAYKKNKGLLFDFLYYGALRISEIPKIKFNSLNWNLWINDIDKPIELTIKQAKGNKDRVVLIPPQVIAKLLDLYLDQANIKPNDLSDLTSTLNSIQRPIFPYKKGCRKVWVIIGDLSQSITGIRMRPHELRHCRATELENMGLGIRAIQHYLGHSSPAITEIYLHTSEKHSLELVKDAMRNEKI